MRVFAYYRLRYARLLYKVISFRVLTASRCPIETDRDRCFLFSPEVAVVISALYSRDSSTTLNIYTRRDDIMIIIYTSARGVCVCVRAPNTTTNGGDFLKIRVVSRHLFCVRKICTHISSVRDLSKVRIYAPRLPLDLSTSVRHHTNVIIASLSRARVVFIIINLVYAQVCAEKE